MAVSWEYPGIPIQGRSSQLQGGLSGDVALKIVRISFVSCSAVLSPGLMAHPIPDVDMQLAISKPLLNERGLQRAPSVYSVR
jgi:hypothetical protein